jgi:hypothetical protein
MSVWMILVCLWMQATVPASDPTMDWLLDQSSAPASQPTTQPATARPFGDAPAPGERSGTITLSDGKSIPGLISTTPAKPLRVWSEKEKRYIDLPWEAIASLEAKILWERDEPEWRFKESGFDEKVFTGKTYPARETEYVITLTTGDTVTGGVVAPIYLRPDQGKAQQFVLHKRAKGEVGKSLDELIYIKRIELK